MKKHRNNWALKISLITFGVGMVVGFSSNIASSESGLVVASLVIAFLLVVSALMDGLGVAVASCKLAEVNSVRCNNAKIRGLAEKMVKNAERVNNICNDVIGDVCSVLSGACGAEIVIELMRFIPDELNLLTAVTVSSFLAALTVGSKALVKSIAINKSAEFVVYSASVMVKVMSVFSKKYRGTN